MNNLYEINGIDDYKLRSIEDILTIHNVDIRKAKGYKGLNNVNKSLYEKFIVNIFNAFGLDSMATLKPKGIYFVEHIEYLVKENPEDDYFIVSGGAVNAIDKNGTKTNIRKWQDEDYKDHEVVNQEVTNYLRFEYIHHKRKEWLHVSNENSWY